MKQAGRVLSIVLSLTFVGLVAHGQTKIAAKANNYQPQPGSSGDGPESDRARDGLLGPVRRVRTEVVKVSAADGKLVENGKRTLLETAEYDLKGSKVQNQYFPVAGSTPTGREVYKYDEKGNISEMTLMGADGSLIGKEVYKYDYDSLGNWVKMTTSIAVVENGRIGFEATEVTYRTIFYYLDATMTKMLEPSTNTAATGKTESAVQPPRPNNSNSGAPTSRNSKPTASKLVTALPGSITPKLTKLTAQPQLPDFQNSAVTMNQKIFVTESEPPPPPQAGRLTMSSGVLNGKAISLPPPHYPEAARRMQVVGMVKVEVMVDENGKVISARALSGPGVLREVSVQAAYQAKFTPTKLSGQPMKVTGTIIYNFTQPW